jgi:type II secretory pathway component PulF
MVSTSAIPLMMLAALLGFFMPVIEELFVEVNRELSAPTQLLLDMSPYWYLVIPLMALAPVLLILSLQSFFRTGRGERMTWPIAIGVTITGAVIVVGFLVISLILPMISILRNNQ